MMIINEAYRRQFQWSVGNSKQTDKDWENCQNKDNQLDEIWLPVYFQYFIYESKIRDGIVIEEIVYSRAPTRFLTQI